MNANKNVNHVRAGSPLLSGLLYASVWLAAGAVLLSLLLHYGGLKEDGLPAGALGIHGISTLAGGFVSGKRSGFKGWYYGGALGLIYGLLVLIISFLAADAALSSRTALLLLIAALAGSFGGMIGVNWKK
ncbi:TIGR04086 family membrane protein [Paenibacillus beijingensis]|nr:TIGR04086 family membrane protein [Paenibacillus beijingensis]